MLLGYIGDAPFNSITLRIFPCANWLPGGKMPLAQKMNGASPMRLHYSTKARLQSLLTKFNATQFTTDIFARSKVANT